MATVVFLKRRPMRVTAGVFASAILVAMTAWIVGPPSFVRLARPLRDRQNLEELAFALSHDSMRPVEGRLSGAFRYARVRSDRGAGDRPSIDVTIAAAKLEKAYLSDDSAPRAADAGVALLVVGEWERAVDALELATQDDPVNAAYQNDLAVAYLARATRADRAEDLPKAVAAAERAVRANDAFEPAWFNRALAIEKLGLRAAASTAWSQAADRQTDAQWRDEARQRAAIGRPAQRLDWDSARLRILAASDGPDRIALDGDYRELARIWLEDVALPAWGAAYAAGDRTGADRRFREARSLARWLAHAGGDAMPRAGIEAVERANTAGDAGLSSALALAHVAFGRAREAAVANRISSAAATLRAAAPRFRRARSPYADWAAIYGAVADRANGDNAAAGRDLASIPPQNLAAFQYLRARAAWLDGLIHMSAGQLDEAGQHFSDALSDLLAGGETEGVIAMRSVIAEHSFYVGDSEQAWRMSHQALALLDQTRSTDRQELTLIIAGFLASWQDLPEAALHFESAYVDLARHEHDATNIPESLLHRAQTYERLGLHDRAIADLQAATAALPDVPDTALRERRANEIRVAIGLVDRLSDPQRARAELTRALDFFEKGQFSLRGVRLHLARGRVAIGEGREDEARRDYLTGIEEFEHQRAGWTMEQTRLSSFDEAWSLFDEMIRLESARSDAHAAAALEIAERGRAQALLDAIRGTVRDRLPIAALQRRLGPDADVLFYATLDEALLVWHITADDVTSARIPTDRSDLERRVRRFTSAIERDDVSAVGALGRTLFSTLVGPVARTLHPNGPLVVIGDGVIQRIPFAALVTDSGRYLVEERSIAWSPSLSVYASEPVSSMDRSAGGALIVVPPTAREDVAALPGAQSEGRQVARQYAGAALLTGDGADVRGFLAAARDARVLHFAGHSVVNPRYPALSYLQLGGPTPATGRLFATTIAAQDFSHADLVVLASCSSAAGKQVRGEGVLSLARPFLAGGAAAVVAALWDLDDRQAEPFFSAFHERYAAGDSAADALRAVQLAYVARSEPRTLRIWASVMVSGRARGLFGRGAHRR